MRADQVGALPEFLARRLPRRSARRARGAQRDSYGQIGVRQFDQELPVWAPASGGAVRIEHGRARDSESLALSWWRSPRDHDRQALAEDDLVRLSAEVVVLDPSWTVPPAV